MLTKNLHIGNSVSNINTTGPSLDGKGHWFSISQTIVFNDRFQAFKFSKARSPLAQCTTPRNVTRPRNAILRTHGKPLSRT